MMYEFYCGNCLTNYTVENRSNPGPCPVCNYRRPKRQFSFNIQSSFHSHYNTSTGTYVRNKTHFSDTLKRQSESASQRLGIEHNFVPVDYHDKESLGVTDEGMEPTYRRTHEWHK